MVFGILRSKGSMRRREEDPDGTKSAARRNEADRVGALPKITETPPTSLTWRPAAPVLDGGDRSSAPAAPEAAPEAGPGDHATGATLRDRIIDALRTVHDPEIPVNIYDLGLIYELNIDDACKVDVKMTLTAPGCPVAGEMPGWVESAVRGVDGVEDATVEIVWDPVWNPDMMTEAARLELGFV